MDVREKLYDLFQDCNNPSWNWFPDNAEMLNMIDYLIANDVTVHDGNDNNVLAKWISVNDMLPEQPPNRVDEQGRSWVTQNIDCNIVTIERSFLHTLRR